MSICSGRGEQIGGVMIRRKAKKAIYTLLVLFCLFVEQIGVRTVGAVEVYAVLNCGIMGVTYYVFDQKTGKFYDGSSGWTSSYTTDSAVQIGTSSFVWKTDNLPTPMYGHADVVFLDSGGSECMVVEYP